MSEIELDLTLLTDFVVESKELLEDCSANIIELEKNPEDPKFIGAIFRAAHTIKGSSAFFNLIHIKNFSHKLENLLDDIRNKRRKTNSQIIDFLLEGSSHLKSMFGRLEAGDYRTELLGDEDRFIQGLIGFLERKELGALTPEEALLAIGGLLKTFKETGGSPEKTLSAVDAVLSDLLPAVAPPRESAPDRAAQTTEKIYRYQGTDLSEPLGQAVKLIEEAGKSGTLDDTAYDQAMNLLEEIVETNNLTALKGPLAEGLDDFRAVRDSRIGFDPMIVNLLNDRLNTLINMLETTAKAPDEPATVGPIPASVPKTDQIQAPIRRMDRAERKSMRIDEDKVDGFMNYVGELIVTQETFNYLQKMIEHDKVNPQTVRAFKNANQAFRELSDELQESLMEIRRVPIKGLLQKATLMARELAHQMGKKVKVDIQGQDVQIDKSIAESLEGPLVHVVRNSLDHGLELPEERRKLGKPPEGALVVMAAADKESFYLSVMDDGRGIDPENMRQAAVNKGLMSESQAKSLTDKEAIAIVFRPGFSTAKEITDVSGRGVGMDVVKTNISQMNGSINIDSIPTKGTTIQIKIPLSVTLQVVKALLVRVGRDYFIISLDDVIESLRPAPQDLATVSSRGEIINRRGQILPLIRLYEILNLKADITDPSAAILVVIETSYGRHALMVDEVLGQQQVVVKELEAHFKNLSFIAGSATLGDGRLGLVLEAEGVVKLAQSGI